jgi:hypothetical protein
MSILSGPHGEIPATEFAAWVEQQGADTWWSVDGDSLLTGRLTFPCPGDELAAEVRRINRPLLVGMPKKTTDTGVSLKTADLDTIVSRFADHVEIKGTRPIWTNDRLLSLSWKDSGEDWLLIEDEETSESSHADSPAHKTS